MKVVNLETFRKLPACTVFMKYEPYVFGGLQIKGDTWKTDFLSKNITYEPRCVKGCDFVSMYTMAEHTKEDIQLDFDCLGRDGCYDEEQLFAVYSRQDVKMLVATLTECL